MKPVAIAFTVYPVTDLHRARRFYEGTLGLTASRITGAETLGSVEYDLGPHTLAIARGGPLPPSAGGGMVVIEVQDFDEALARLREHKVPFVIESLDIPTCRLSIFSDPDGNTVAVHQRKEDLAGPAIVHQ